MNTESIPPLSPSSTSSVSTEETHPLSLPLFLSSSSSSLKPLRERNRTNLKRRINLSRSQVLSNDFENEDNLPRTNSTNKPITTPGSSQQPPSTRLFLFIFHFISKIHSKIFLATLHPHAELYSKTISPKTPSPIHTTVTCSQVWERLASSEEHQNLTSPKPVITPTTSSTSSLPTHISFSYDPSDGEDEEGDDLLNNDQDDFQYVPVSSQSKLVQFQFLTFARQQLDINDDESNEKQDSSDDDDDDEEDEGDDTLVGQDIEEDQNNDDDDSEEQEVINSFFFKI